MKKFLGYVYLSYVLIILYIIVLQNISNFLAPKMQNYLYIALVMLIILSIVMLFKKHIHYKFKKFDLILLLPILLVFLSGDGLLSMNLATNKNNDFDNIYKDVVDDYEPSTDSDFVDDELLEEELGEIYFDIIDSSYEGLVNYLTFHPSAKEYIGKSIRIRGFSINETNYMPKKYFAIGKYLMTCCAADTSFAGLIIEYDLSKIKNNTWYEIEGILAKGKDINNDDIIIVKAKNVKEIDKKSEEQYVYSCYSYGDGMCSEINKYNLKY